MDIKKKLDILGLDDEEYEEYFRDFDNNKALETYEQSKEKTDVKQAVYLLNALINEYKLDIDKSFIENLLIDDDLREYIISDKKSKNNLVIKLREALNNSEENESDIDDEEVEKILESESKEIADGDFPLYTVEEEVEAFNKYYKLKKKLMLYIYQNRHKPEYKEFIKYIANLRIEKDGVPTKMQNKDNLAVRAIGELYRNTDIEAIVNVQKDPKLSSIIEDLKELRDDISYHNTGLVMSIAKKYDKRGLPKDDLIQEGTLGLLKAINKFEPRRGNKFSTFGVWWIRQAVKRALANEGTTIRIPVHLRDSLYKIRIVENTLRYEDETDEPSAEDIYQRCKEMGYKFSLEQIQQYIRVKVTSTPVSADQYVGEDEDTPLLEFLASQNDETPEQYAEKVEKRETTNRILAEVAAGKHISKNERQRVRIIFKEITFYTRDKDKITILLTEKEHAAFSDKDLPREEKRKRFIDLLNRYGINPNLLTGSVRVVDKVMTSGEREALVYRFRTGVTNEESDQFLERRNRNYALFGPNEIREKLTLETTGKLFGVTRERIRQIESRTERKVNIALGNVEHKSSTSLDLYIGNRANVYDILRVSPSNTEYFLSVKPNPVISVDENGNIITLGETGVGVIILRNMRNNIVKELIVCVHPSLKESISAFVAKKRLLLKNKENEKDNQF